MRPDDFWSLSYYEFISAIIALNPELNSSNEPFFDDEEQALLEQMKGW